MKKAVALMPNKIILSKFCNTDITLTKRDINFLTVLCSYIDPEDQPDKVYQINKIDLIHKFGFSKHSFYRDLKNALIRLQSFVFNVSENAPKSVKAVNTFKHTNDYNSTFISITFDSEFHSMVTDIEPGCEGFTRIQVDKVLKFKHQHTKKLYMILSRYKENDIIDFDLSDLRNKLDLVDKYQDTNDLLKRAMIPAVNEMVFTDKPFKFEPVKQGKKIVSLRLTMLKPNSMEVLKNEFRISPIINSELNETEKNQFLGYLRGKLFLSEEQAAYVFERIELKDLQPVCKGIEKAFTESRTGIRTGLRKILPEKYAGYTASTLRRVFGSTILNKEYKPLTEAA